MPVEKVKKESEKKKIPTSERMWGEKKGRFTPALALSPRQSPGLLELSL